MRRVSHRGKYIAMCHKEARAMIKNIGLSGAVRFLFKKIGIVQK